jgi:hypothetical protein
MTQAFGISSAADAILMGGTPLPISGFTGSRDGQVVPVP